MLFSAHRRRLYENHTLFCMIFIQSVPSRTFFLQNALMIRASFYKRKPSVNLVLSA